MQVRAVTRRRRRLIAVLVVAAPIASLLLLSPQFGRSEASDTTATTDASTTSAAPTSEPTTPVSDRPTSCLERANQVVLEGPQGQFPADSTELVEGSAIDARRATWDNATASDRPVHLRAVDTNERNDLCWLGGRISSDYPDDTSWDYWHGVTGFRVRVPRITIDGVRIHNEGDGIGFSDDSRDWTIRNAHLSYIHDDCIENDYMHNGLVESSLLDGCFVAFSSRGHSGQSAPPNGLSQTLTIKDSLVRLQPMPTVYKGPAPGHGPFFKWSNDPDEGIGVRLSIHNSVFRADQEPNNGGLGIPTYHDPETGKKASHLADCSNNIVVWLGEGPFPDKLPSCFTVTTDPSVWDEAVARWLEAHPENR